MATKKRVMNAAISLGYIGQRSAHQDTPAAQATKDLTPLQKLERRMSELEEENALLKRFITELLNPKK